MKIVVKNRFNYLDKGFFMLFILGITFALSSFTIPKKLEKKVKKQITQTFKVEEYVLNAMDIPKENSIKIITNTNFNKIITNHKLIGYALIDKAKSKSYDFDYLVLLNPKLEIVNIKILIYREEHGNEISSKRWLKQFFKLSFNDNAILQDNIDGISGATISVRSMTTEMNILLQDLKILFKNKTLTIK